MAQRQNKPLKHGAAGGLARAANLSAEELSKQGGNAVAVRWAKPGAGKKHSDRMKAIWEARRRAAAQQGEQVA
jgi:hypothetical protein